LRSDGKVRLFAGSHGYPDGGQQRDFVAVEDVAKVSLFFLDHPQKSGIFNVGSGEGRSFNDLAAAAVNGCRRAKNEAPLDLAALQAQGLLEYIAFPEALEGKYQAFTQADLTHLRAAGYVAPMVPLEEGVASYMEWLDKNV
jgi:ADP-L-glycero-D-manno-heptose 6-epimerase